MNLLVSHFMQDLPPEIIEYIANLDNQVWHILVHVYKFLYLKTMDQTYVDDLKRKFLRYKSQHSILPQRAQSKNKSSNAAR